MPPASRSEGRVLVLDFDGVIARSAPEALLVARRTHEALLPDLPLPGPEEALARGFVRLMPFGNRAEDYGAALRALALGVELPDQAAYDAFKAGLPEQMLRAFHRRFYQERRRLEEEDPGRWLELLEPYPEVVALLRRRGPERTLAIATAKDRHSVGRLLDHYGISDLFAPELRLDKETGVTKDLHLRHLRERLGVPFEAMTFVDDKVHHLDRVAPLGVRCVLAGWGYNTDREAELARAHGHEVATLRDAEARLFGPGG